MTERLIFVVHLLGWILAIANTLTFAVCLWCDLDYEKSMQKRLDALRGVTRTWPYKRAFWVAVIAWSAVYITY